MSKITISKKPSIFLSDNAAKTTSIALADSFGKRHDDVLKKVRNIIKDLDSDFTLRNFAECSKTNDLANGKKEPYYEMTRDGFVLLAMGFTGKQALQWKVKYIEAFNAMEATLKGELLPATVTPKQKSLLKQAMEKRCQIDDSYRGAMWGRFNNHFMLSSYSELPASRFNDAMDYIPNMPHKDTQRDSPEHIKFMVENAVATLKAHKPKALASNKKQLSLPLEKELDKRFIDTIEEVYSNISYIQKDLSALDAIDFSHPSSAHALTLMKQDMEDAANTVFNDMEKLFSFKDVLVCRAIDMMNQKMQLTAQ